MQALSTVMEDVCISITIIHFFCPLVCTRVGVDSVVAFTIVYFYFFFLKYFLTLNRSLRGRFLNNPSLYKSHLLHRSCIDLISSSAGMVSSASLPLGMFWIFLTRCRSRTSSSCCFSTPSPCWRRESNSWQSSSVGAASFALEISGRSS